MENLLDVQLKQSRVLSSIPGLDQNEDIVSKGLYEISKSSLYLIKVFYEQKELHKKVDIDKLKESLLAVIRWTSSLFSVIGLDPPELSDVEYLADTLDSEICVDIVLAATNLQRSISNFCLSYYCDGPKKMDIDSADEDLGEVLACTGAILNRFGLTIQDIIK